MSLKQLGAVLLFAVALALSGQSAFAQQYTLSNTTLNGAVDASQTTFVLTSASASAGSSFGAPAAGQCYFVDGELGRIVSMASTTATVQRASGGGSTSNASPHATLAVIWTGACNAFKQADPPNVTGNQTCSAQPRPWINVKNANTWICSTATNKWTGTNFMPFTFNSVPIGQ